MRYGIALGLFFLLLAAAAVAWALRFPEIEPTLPPTADSLDQQTVERGEILAAIGSCAVCHTRPGGERYAGGLPVETPFGVIYATNITPDPLTGIGAWSADAFRRAMQQGVDRNGRYLYPAFPYDHFTKVTETDVDAIYAYLMSREPVEYVAPEPDLEFPFNQRILLAGWNLLFLDDTRFESVRGRSDAWNRGAYLVEGLGHCGACHTPRNMAGAIDNRVKFAGASVEGWHAPALNQDSPAPLPWTADALVNYLLLGWDRDHGIAEGPMTAVVDELAVVSEDDIYAMADYLLSFQPQTGDQGRATAAAEFATSRAFGSDETPSQGPEFDDATPDLAAGASLFANRCANCHRAGSETTPLGLSSSVNGPDPRNAIYAIENGIDPPANSFDKSMPSFGGALSDDEMTSLVRFIRSHFSQAPAWENLHDHVRQIRTE